MKSRYRWDYEKEEWCGVTLAYMYNKYKIHTERRLKLEEYLTSKEVIRTDGFWYNLFYNILGWNINGTNT